MIDCKAGDRKHQIAEDYLAEHPPRTGVFLILVARAPATVWKVSRSGAGVICNLEKRKEFVNHYSFHIMDPTWGHGVASTTPVIDSFRPLAVVAPRRAAGAHALAAWQVPHRVSFGTRRAASRGRSVR